MLKTDLWNTVAAWQEHVEVSGQRRRSRGKKKGTNMRRETNRNKITERIKTRRKQAKRKEYKHSVNEEGLERRMKMKEDMKEIIR